MDLTLILRKIVSICLIFIINSVAKAIKLFVLSIKAITKELRRIYYFFTIYSTNRKIIQQATNIKSKSLIQL